MYNKILIANRGEIAVRIIGACRELGIKSVAIFSEVDRNSLHTQLADEAICIGPHPLKQSYLNIPAILAAAELSGASAIHPGYGFLSEDDDFVEKCTTSNIDFIGPHYSLVLLMGDKVQGRKIAKSVNVPTIPGTKNEIVDIIKDVEKIGYPLMIKAKDGGGGRGMRVVYTKSNLLKAYEFAKSEAEATFNSSSLFVEKYIEKPRHVEVQIIADKHGNCIHLGDRDCSSQRRHQKIIEESPAANLSAEIRKKIHDSAIKIAKKVKYFSAGTIEFLVDKNENFYFIEMNTRLQVEHPVSEMVTGVDLVKEQIRIACGEKLSFKQKDIKIKGHAIECRITAEDPENMHPSPGVVTKYREPGGFGVRVDSGIYQGSIIQPYYDSLISKLITYGNSREEARIKMIRALKEYQIEGVKTIIPFHIRILNSLHFIDGKINTDSLNQFINIDKKTIN